MSRTRMLLLLALGLLALPLWAGVQAQTPTPLPTLGPPIPANFTPPPTAIAGGIRAGDVIRDTFPDNVTEISYTFAGEAGQNISITLTGIWVYSGCLELKSGTISVYSTGTGGYGSAIIPYYTLPTTATYTIIIRRCSTDTGAYTLTLDAVSIEPIAYDLVVEGELQEAQASIAYQLSGEQGDLIAISLMSDDFDPLVWLSQESQAGPAFLVGDDNNGGNLNAFIGPFRLPASGSYIVSARSAIPTSGRYTLLVNRIEAQPIAYGDTVEATFSRAVPLRLFTFDGQNGDLVSAWAESGGTLDTTLALIDTSNNNMFSVDDDSGGGLDPEISQQVLFRDDMYYILLRPYSIGDVGSARLTLMREAVASLDTGAQQVLLDSKVRQSVLLFTGVANERVRLTLIRVRARIPLNGQVISANLNVIQGDQSVASTNLQGGDTLVIEFVVPADGEVRVILQNSSNINTRYEVSLERLE